MRSCKTRLSARPRNGLGRRRSGVRRPGASGTTALPLAVAGPDLGLARRRAVPQRVVRILGPPADDIELRQLSAAEAAVASLPASSASQLAFASTQPARMPGRHGDLDGQHVEDSASLRRREVVDVGGDDVSVTRRRPLRRSTSVASRRRSRSLSRSVTEASNGRRSSSVAAAMA